MRRFVGLFSCVPVFSQVNQGEPLPIQSGGTAAGTLGRSASSAILKEKGAHMSSQESTANERVCASIRKLISALVGLSLGIFLIALPLFSQGNLGRILGAVTDQTGGVMAGATVTVLDVDRGTSRILTTDQAGEYNAPNLTPGTYTVRAEAVGFKTAESANILVEVGNEIRVDLSMQPGEQNEKITVSESIPMIETTNAVLGGTLSHDMIIDLPLNGRNYENLLMLKPGTIVNPGGNERQSTNGLRGTDNVYLVDGLANDEVYTGLSMLNSTPFAGDAGVLLPVDSIQEFNVSSNPKAELGLKPGGVVSVGIKSGTNTISGSAFAFGRDTSFDAKNFFGSPNYGGCTEPVQQSMSANANFLGAVGRDVGRTHKTRQAVLVRRLRRAALYGRASACEHNSGRLRRWIVWLWLDRRPTPGRALRMRSKR